MVTLEDNTEKGGYGSQVSDLMEALELHNPCLRIAWPDEFVSHGSTEQLMKKYRLDAQGIAERVERFLERERQA